MKTSSKISSVLACLALMAFVFTSCQKSGQSPAKTNTTGNSLNTAAFSTYQAIAVDASPGDTVYAVNVCERGNTADSVSFGALPDTIGKYLTANYQGYTFKRAYEIFNAGKGAQSYVVIITYNNYPVALSFTANGMFIRVLEQREGRDLKGQGWHEGGRFDNRDGHHRDTIALTALPVTITSYFATTYPSDTLKHAFVNCDGGYTVISADAGVFVNVFTKAGLFVKRVQVYPHIIAFVVLTQTDLPAEISTYLTTTYPAYVFDSAFEVTLNGAAKGYAVIIEANTTKYFVTFNSSGTFVKAYSIR